MECNHCLHGKETSEITCIERVPIFANLTSDERLEIAMITTDRVYKRGEIIYLAGQKEEKLYVIHQGKVKISRISEAGKEQIIRILEPGDFMGELSLFTHKVSNSNAEALETTTVCIIDGNRLSRIISNRPTIAVKIIEELSKRLQSAENLIEALGLQDVEKRVASFLLSMSNEKNEVVLSITKKDLASHIGMSQETLSRKLSLFQDMGWIKQIGNRRIIILDRESLDDIANI